MAMFRGPNFKTPLCRLSYAQSLYKPRSMEAGKAPQYSCTLIFDKKDKPELEKMLLEVMKGEWGDKAIERAKAGLIKSPFLPGDGKEARNKDTGELHPGMGADKFFIRVSSNEDRPPFVIWKDPNKQETETTVYSGCYGKGTLNAFAWHNAKSGDGVSFGIQGFQKLREGDPLGGGGRANAADYFEKVESEEIPAEIAGNDGVSGLFG